MRRPFRLIALLASGALALSACGSGDDTSSNGNDNDSTGATSEEATAAATFVEPYLEQPTSINIDVPLETKPEAGVKVGWLEGNVDTITVLTPGFEAATEALGWELVILGYDPANPQSLNAAMQQGVDQGVDYLVVSGINSPAYESALKNAKEAGIPLVQIDLAAEADGADKGILACIACDSMVSLWGEILGKWMVADSNATAQVAYFTIPEFSSLIPEGEALDKALSECSDCSLDVHEETVAAFTGGTLPANVAAYIQTHPDIDYIYFAFGQMEGGVRAALDAAGLGKDVKFVVAAPVLPQVQEIIDGKISAAALLPVEGHTWAAVDAMARDSVGMDVSVTEDAPIPVQIWTGENVPEPAQLFHGAVDYENQFKALWLVE